MRRYHDNEGADELWGQDENRREDSNNWESNQKTAHSPMSHEAPSSDFRSRGSRTDVSSAPINRQQGDKLIAHTLADKRMKSRTRLNGDRGGRTCVIWTSNTHSQRS